MGIKIDLHIHSNKSDGALSPFQIIDTAKKHGVEVLSITDHDTVGAYSAELFDYAKNNGLTIIPGIEISTKHEKGGYHVLGYNIDVNNKDLLEELQKMRNSRKEYLSEITEKLLEFGFVVNFQKLDKVESVTKGNVAEDVIANPVNHIALKSYFGHIPTKSEFITTLLLKGCPAYIRKTSTTPLEAVELIRKAGGKAVLAHPIAYFYDKRIPKEDTELVIREIMPDGVETNYIHHDKLGVKRNEHDEWHKVAESIGASETVGSDFHNNDGERCLIGFVNDEMNFDEKQIKNLLDKILEQKN